MVFFFEISITIFYKFQLITELIVKIDIPDKTK